MNFNRLHAGASDWMKRGVEFVEIPIGLPFYNEQLTLFHVSKVFGCFDLGFLENILNLANAERPLQKKVHYAKSRGIA